MRWMKKRGSLRQWFTKISQRQVVKMAKCVEYHRLKRFACPISRRDHSTNSTATRSKCRYQISSRATFGGSSQESDKQTRQSIRTRTYAVQILDNEYPMNMQKHNVICVQPFVHCLTPLLSAVGCAVTNTRKAGTPVHVCEEVATVQRSQAVRPLA